jgi:pimeloyl-ACP methyl ester carboxylesterase
MPRMSAVRLYLTCLCTIVAGCNPALRRGADEPPFADLSPIHRANLEVTGFFQPDKLADRAGIYVSQPYQPGKVPVIFVHGFASTPATWRVLYHELQADPELRERCQFWFYYYPTGTPYLVSAADLRERLNRLREQLDPGHADWALDNMVVIGHSMGGLVAKLLAVDGGDDFWRLVCGQRMDSLHMKPETRAEFERVLYFRRQPSVRRVVFLATPHHGAKISASPAAKLAAHLAVQPRRLIEAARDVTRQNPQAEFHLTPDKLPNSLTLLQPGDPSLELLAARPLPSAVHFHSVVGVGGPTGVIAEWLLAVNTPIEKTDGVVTYASAHLDGVESESIVPADHTHVQSHPIALQEIRRILREHLREISNLRN